MSLLQDLFITVVNMSIAASYVAIGVIFVRLLLKKAPKIFSYILWAPVLFRLVCPFSFDSAFSFFNLINLNAKQGIGVSEFVPQNIGLMQTPAIQSSIGSIDSAVNASLPPAIPVASVNPMQIWMTVFSLIWIFGVITLFIYSIISYVKIKRKLQTATRVDGNVFETDAISMAFVCGFIRPKIYVPANIGDANLSYILEHERTHIRRKDYLIKPIAFLALILHWFNPLMWLCFALMSRDMEMSCDESVLNRLGEGAKGGYSGSLLSLAVKRKGLLAANPLAFGESHVKARIKNVLSFKKPAFWVIMIAVVAVCAAVVAFAANAKDKGTVAVNPGKNTFEIYMVVVPQDGIYRLDGYNLTALPLEKEPILTDKDLVTYHWGIKEHTDILEVRDGISIRERLKEKGYMGAGAGVSPFVVVCSGERIYVGVFSTPISSMALPKYASVYMNAIASNQNTYEVLALKGESEKLLHDRRIYNTLDSLNKLKDYTPADVPGTDVIKKLVEENLAVIISSPKGASNPYVYIQAHQGEYENIKKLGGEEALQYMLSQFKSGNAEGLRGHIMMQLCKELLGARNNVNDETLTPQEWYDALSIRQEVKLPDFEYDGNDPIEKLVYATEIEKNSQPQRGFTIVAPKTPFFLIHI